MNRKYQTDVSDFTREEDAAGKLVKPTAKASTSSATGARPIDALGKANRKHKVGFTVYLRVDELDALEKHAKDLERPKTEIVRLAVRHFLGIEDEE